MLVSRTRNLGVRYGSPPWRWVLGPRNLITVPRAFGSWDVLGSTVNITANQSAGPDGSLTADAFAEATDVAETHQIGKDFANAAGVHEVCVVGKFITAGRAWMRVYVMDNGGGSGVPKGTWWNCQTGAIGTALGTIASAAAATWRGGWLAMTYRYTGDGATGDNTLRIASGSADDADAYNGDGRTCFHLAMAGVRAL